MPASDYRPADDRRNHHRTHDEPELFIVEDNQQNAFAIKHGSKSYVVLIDDTVFGAMATGNAGALHFIIAHELAHHALGHKGALSSPITDYYSRFPDKMSFPVTPSHMRSLEIRRQLVRQLKTATLSDPTKQQR